MYENEDEVMLVGWIGKDKRYIKYQIERQRNREVETKDQTEKQENRKEEEKIKKQTQENWERKKVLVKRNEK